MRISLDTETTGVDFHHGSKPYFVTICFEDTTQLYWEWPVNPANRLPVIPPEDLEEIRDVLEINKPQSTLEVILQNSKFDVKALHFIGIHNWPWERTHDTLIAGHLLASNQPHDLTSMSLHYLGVNVEPLEEMLHQVTESSRRWARTHRPDWHIAKKGREDMPSAKEECWKLDGWLNKLVYQERWKECAARKAWEERQEILTGERHGWQFRPPQTESLKDKGGVGWSVLADYANADSAMTLALWNVMEKELKKRDLWEIYLERRKLPAIAYKMEQRGVTINKERLQTQLCTYDAQSDIMESICVEIAQKQGCVLKLPKSGSSKQLHSFCFGNPGLNLPKVKKTKNGNASLDKGALEHYEALFMAEPESDRYRFVKALKDKRAYDTAITYMNGYSRFWHQYRACVFLPGSQDVYRNWYVLHPSINPTGTDTLRWSHQNPNSGNISKRESFNLRYSFGPAPDREWWSLDYENIELRIPAYISGEEVMIELFERPEDPPYFGSYHLMNASIIYPDLFWPLAEEKGAFKKKYAATWYQWCKNFGFAYQYGGGEATCDRAAHKIGSFAALGKTLTKLTKLNKDTIAFADRHGFVETLIDRQIQAKRGYPILCTRTEWGKVLPTVPLNYKVQSTAMWCTSKAMVRCDDYLTKLSQRDPRGYYLALQIHDEMVFDFPKGKTKFENLPKVRTLRRLMEKSGEDIGVPLKVAITYNPVCWSEGESCT